MEYKIIQADFLEWIKEYDGPQFAALLSDWPYNLESITKRFGSNGAAPAKKKQTGVMSRKSGGFMGATWDSDIAYHPETWELIKPLLLPGAFTMSFTHVRKQHRLACAVDDAGYLIEPAIYNYHVPAQMGWVYGSGMPHGTSVNLNLDDLLGVEGRVVGKKALWGHNVGNGSGSFYANGYAPENGKRRESDIIAPGSTLAQIWQGYQYGSPLAPEIEPIIIAQAPWQGHRRNTILETGAGAMNIAFGQSQKCSNRYPGTLILEHHPGCLKRGYKGIKNTNGSLTGNEPGAKTSRVYGKFKHNNVYEAADTELIPDYDCHPDCHVSRIEDNRQRYFYESDWSFEIAERLAMADPVYYCSKVGVKERNAGCEALQDRTRNRVNGGGLENEERFAPTIQKNNHPTLKPIALTKYLAGLLLPPKEYAPRRIIIPCAGTGSEMIGAALAGWDEIIGIESNPEYVQIAKARLAWWSRWLAWGQTDVDAILSSIAVQDKEPEQKQLSFI